jgi:hypothetical protein
MKPLSMPTSWGFTASAMAALASSVVFSGWSERSCGATCSRSAPTLLATRLGSSFLPSTNPPTRTAMAMRGPRLRRELKLRAAARLGTLVSKNTVQVIETTRRQA